MLLSEGIGGQTFWLAEFPMSHKPNNEIRAECLHKTESSVSVGWFPRVFVCSPTNSNGRLNRSWESSLTLLSFSLRFPTDKSRTLFFALLVRLLLWISTNTRAVNHSEMPIKKCKPLFHSWNLPCLDVTENAMGASAASELARRFYLWSTLSDILLVRHRSKAHSSKDHRGKECQTTVARYSSWILHSENILHEIHLPRK